MPESEWKRIEEKDLTYEEANQILTKSHDIRINVQYLPAHKQSFGGNREGYWADKTHRWPDGRTGINGSEALQHASVVCEKLSGVRPIEYDRIHHVVDEYLEDQPGFASKGDLRHKIIMEAGTISAAINGRVIEENPALSATVIAFEYKR